MKISPTLQTWLVLLQAGSSTATCPGDTSSGGAGGEGAVLTRDVCIVGGGSSGTYAAIRLQQEGYSVALVEKRGRLGGHVDTYRDAATGTVFDYGVGVYANISAVTDYFAHLDVPLVAVPAALDNTILHVNFATDARAAALPASLAWTNQTALGLALAGYLQQQARYPFVGRGFDLPDPVPEDLLLPWGAFLEKHGLQALANLAFMYLQGMGNILAQPTLYVMKYLTQRTALTLLGTGPAFLASGAGGNQALYDAALARLGADAFLGSSVVAIRRGEAAAAAAAGVRVVFDTAAGRHTARCRQLVVAVPPAPASLAALRLDLSAAEAGLFGQFNNSYYWNAVLRAPGLPPRTSLQTIDLAAPYGIPALPGTYLVAPADDGRGGLLTAWYGSPSYASDAAVGAALLGDLARAAAANGFALAAAPEVVALNSHAPFELTVPAAAIRGGFYREADALQGARATWWAGAAWQAPDSSEIWDWMESVLLPRVLAALAK